MRETAYHKIMTAETRLELETQLADYKIKRAAISAQIDSSFSHAEVQTTSFTDAEGSQSVTRRNPADLIAMLANIDNFIAYIQNCLDGTGLVFGNLRRM